MRKTALSLLLLSLACSAYGQNARKPVFFTGEKDCGYKSGRSADEGSVRCSTSLTDRGPVSEIEQDGVALSIAYLEEGDYIIVAARITNSTAEPVMFDTDLWGAAHFKSKTDFSARVKPIVAETSIPTREIIREMSTASRLGNSLDIFIAESQKSSEVKETRRSDGTVIRTTVIVPDKVAQEAAVRKTEIQTEQMTSEQRRIRNNALTAKYVPANGSVKGLVYFRRIKKAELVVLSLNVGDSRFVFRYPRNTK